MFKVFLLFFAFFVYGTPVFAQALNLTNGASSTEAMLSKYINASAVCAKMTDPAALFERGMMLLSDANEDAYIAASDCFTSAAMRNHTAAQLELGKLYEKGLGVTGSKIFAYKWYQTAVLLGNQNAIAPRDSLEARMTLDEISMANPMIQDTLNLLDLFNSRQQEEISKVEGKIAESFKDFGVNIAEYDVQEEEESGFKDNPLIEALIREQQKKEGLQREAMKKRKEGESGEDEPAGRRRRRPIDQTEGGREGEDGQKGGGSPAPSRRMDFPILPGMER